ncbi:putative hydrolase related to dienelactone hydrolase protein [Dioscorea alata]|uniref:Hydrolase related to dienelactone hydrolase protein n=2 Tax=Dioscorea alata TaxID=55571 RepID=A0ACB7VXX0_DIOAL|nr:putative hydrolase related to dienelactone hydrolase protein [Dioscorea alata]
MASSQCCENPPTLNPSAGAGSVLEDFGGLRAYVTGNSESNLAVILASDIYGFESPNLRKFADKVAASGFFVVVPDFFYGDPFVLDDDAERTRPIWLQAHTPEKGVEDAKSVIAALKSKGITSIGAAGFCWGAKVVVELAKSAEIQAGVLLHPAFVSVDDIKDVKSPIAILGAEFDHLSPPQLVKQFEEILSQNSEIDSFVKIFPGVGHGWAVRWQVDDDFAIKSAEEAHKDTLDWFLKHIK